MPHGPSAVRFGVASVSGRKPHSRFLSRQSKSLAAALLEANQVDGVFGRPRAGNGKLLQLIVGGIAQGCVYGLVALGFVLIYKATEMVNFAQGDLMMLGAFVALTLVGTMGMDYWLGLLLAALIMAVFGYLLDALVLRRIIGQPQFAIVILTISLGFLFRAGAGFVWGHETQTFETPFTNRIINAAGVILPLESLISPRSETPCRPLRRTNWRPGHSSEAHQFADLGALGRGGDHWVCCCRPCRWWIRASASSASRPSPQQWWVASVALSAPFLAGSSSASRRRWGRYLPPGFKEIVATED